MTYGAGYLTVHRLYDQIPPSGVLDFYFNAIKFEFSNPMRRYPERPERKIIRNQKWDYSWPASYFITLNTHNRIHLFGKIINGQLELSEIGKIINEEWEKSFEIRTELFCDAFVIMPDHLHAILRIDYGNEYSSEGFIAHHKGDSKAVAYRVPRSISSFVAGFKSAATKRINEFRNMPRVPVWQARFHDRIIGSEEQFNNTKNYIENNPMKWELKRTGSKPNSEGQRG